MKSHIVRKITREGVKEYAMQGMQFSTRTSKAWGLGALKNALWNVIHYRSYLETKENAIMRYVDRVTEGGRLKVDVLVVDIDSVTIEDDNGNVIKITKDNLHNLTTNFEVVPISYIKGVTSLSFTVLVFGCYVKFNFIGETAEKLTESLSKL